MVVWPSIPQYPPLTHSPVQGMRDGGWDGNTWGCHTSKPVIPQNYTNLAWNWLNLQIRLVTQHQSGRFNMSAHRYRKQHVSACMSSYNQTKVLVLYKMATVVCVWVMVMKEIHHCSLKQWHRDNILLRQRLLVNREPMVCPVLRTA